MRNELSEPLRNRTMVKKGKKVLTKTYYYGLLSGVYEKTI